VIQVRVRQENVSNVVQFIQAQVTYTGAGIDQYIIVNEQSGSA
jgi:hypothetical protein